MPEGIEGQIALVTGAASGIGWAIAELFAKCGAKLALADSNLEGLTEKRELLAERGVDVISVTVDVSCEEQVEAMVDNVLGWYGGLDIFVHSAGVGIERPFLETSDEEWKRLIGIDLTGTFYCLRRVGREMMREGYGRIVTLGSTAGERGGARRAAYGASKAGVANLTKVLAVELAEAGVTVNALAPGAIETELVRRMHSADTRRNYRRSIPMNRYGSPAEVAHAALFLASREASYITGHTLAVDGGFLCAGVLNSSD